MEIKSNSSAHTTEYLLLTFPFMRATIKIKMGVKRMDMEKIKQLICSFGIIFAISFVGDFLHNLIPLPIPGSVYGLIILFCALNFKVVKLEWVEKGADIFIKIMPLLFVPSVVKIVTLQDVILENLVPILLIIVLSTVVVMGVTGRVAQKMIEEKEKGTDV